MDKNILFYSNYCSYSKEIVSNFSKAGLQKELVFICVDDRNIRLPKFITVVPTLYLNKQKKILTEDQISEWIQQQTKSSSNSEEDLMAYHGNIGGYSSSFSFLEENNDSGFVSKFSFLDSTDHSIETPKEFSGNSVKSGKGGMDNALEQLQKARNSEPFSQGISRI